MRPQTHKSLAETSGKTSTFLPPPPYDRNEQEKIMIIDTINHIETYKNLDERIYRGLELLQQNYDGLEDGKYFVDGDNLFYMIQTYETKPDNPFPESHREYADIQCVLSGSEVMGVGSLDEMEQTEAYPERDFYLNRGPVDRVRMTPGKFAVLWPQDGHACAIADGECATVHKIVVKIKLK